MIGLTMRSVTWNRFPIKNLLLIPCFFHLWSEFTWIKVIKVIEQNFNSEVCIKLVALCINRCTRSSSQFQNGWWPLVYSNASISLKNPLLVRVWPMCLSAKLHLCRAVASGGAVVPGPPIWNLCPPHFTFGPLVAAYMQYSILKMSLPLLVFGPPAAKSWRRACTCAGLFSTSIK